MEILMSGEIYLKRGPEVIDMNPVEEDFNDIDDDFGEDEFFENFIENLRNNSDVSEETIESLIKSHESAKDNNNEIRDYSGCSSFWMSIIGENGIKMIEKSEIPSLASTKDIKNKQELDEQFIRLRVFLEKAEYVGKTFHRTKPIVNMSIDGTITKDMSYYGGFSALGNSILVLYATKDHMIAVNNNELTGERSFSVISSKYIEDGNYKFEGEVNEEYRDKAELYQAIFKQLTNNPKKKL